ncbi:hypothetical protein L4174_020115 [Photobacterium sp. CCB-ST2H9]|uniref:hypothetical protein n=1 Tax=Photobacterium sp. CCB-ST2H9 TaxID=2912855 RepID=UPI00200397A0|nr:hypothetical protein [Photobacterium sp. CCB-ST2H9]UTM59024.1 hypothetical protein L4174_020115 [Photobacterium sp. CCB-ST2H9]
MAADTIKIVNDSDTRVLFSNFNAGDNFIPFDTLWLDPGKSGELKTGNFNALSIGAQVQEGGRWIGGDPKNKPYATPGDTVTFTISKDISG